MFALRTAFGAIARTGKFGVRTFTFLSKPRPTIFGLAPLSANPLPTPLETVAPRISASPVLRALQVRNGPRNTFNPSHRVRKRRHGFLSRIRTRTGRSTLKRRQAKGRKSLSH